MGWIVEPPTPNSPLIDDSCRIVEVDDDGRFLRVIAKLHRDISPESASIMCCVAELFEAIRMIDEDLETRTYPDEDDDETDNDLVLDSIEQRVFTVLELISSHRAK